MEKTEYRNIYLAEDNHFFYKANHKLILDLVKKFTKGSNLKILDAGCGTGLLAKKLEQYGNVIGVDISDEALKYSKKRKINVKKASITNLKLQSNFFDLVVSIDVLYHLNVEKDTKALDEFYRVLKPGGILIIRVPALNWLKRSCDMQVHTRKRYSTNELKAKLKKTKFKILKISYVNFLLLPPAVLSFFIEKIKGVKAESPLVKLPKFLNQLIYLVLSQESYIIQKNSLPLGLGVIAVAQKLSPKPNGTKT